MFRPKSVADLSEAAATLPTWSAAMSKRTNPILPSVAQEFAQAKLGDERRTRRAQRVVERFSHAPALSFPQQMETSKELEGLYRFVNSRHVSEEALLEAHVAQTCARANEHALVLVLHDTSEFESHDGIEGVGYLGRNRRGFLLHE